MAVCILLTACAARPTPTPIPEPTATAQPTTAPTHTPVPTPTHTITPTPVLTPTPIVYVVQAGDVLGTIARKYGTTVEAIVKANAIADPDFIRQGQELVIPPPGPTPLPLEPTAAP